MVRLWWKPLVTLIWGGGLVMMAGAAMSLMDRRLRVGAPSRRRKQADAVRREPAMKARLSLASLVLLLALFFAGAALR